MKMAAHIKKQETELDKANKKLYLANIQNIKLQEKMEALQVVAYTTDPFIAINVIRVSKTILFPPSCIFFNTTYILSDKK